MIFQRWEIIMNSFFGLLIVPYDMSHKLLSKKTLCMMMIGVFLYSIIHIAPLFPRKVEYKSTNMNKCMPHTAGFLRVCVEW